MPEKGEHLIHLIQAQARLVLLQIAEKPKPNSRLGSEFNLGQPSAFPSIFNEL
jgi:hypothetical protein